MPDDTPLSEAAQQVMQVMYQQLGTEITRNDLRDHTRLTDSALLGALSELQNRQWIEHTGYPGSPSGDTWRAILLGQSAVPQGTADSTLSKTQEGTIILRPPRSRGLIRGLGIAALLYALLLVVLMLPDGKWVATRVSPF
jgi:DNA-binding HxlR family transcriptional regulator